MTRTRRTVAAAMLAALIVAVGQALSGVPNVELVTFLVFVSGYLLGVRAGAATGMAAMAGHSAFNPLGPAAPPVLAAQVLAGGLTAVVGGWLGARLARQDAPRGALMAGALGAALTVIYQAAVNVAAWVAYPTGLPLWSYVAGGLAFAATHVAWNAGVFAGALRPTLVVVGRVWRGALFGVVLVAALVTSVPSVRAAARARTNARGHGASPSPGHAATGVRAPSPAHTADGVRAEDAGADTTRAASNARDAVDVAARHRGAWNVLDAARVHRRHPWSVLRALGELPGWTWTRSGPPGFEAGASRLGAGAGRARVTLDGVPLNDPVDGRAPLADLPLAGLGAMRVGPAGAWDGDGVAASGADAGGTFRPGDAFALPGPAGLDPEGVVRLEGNAPPERVPLAAFDLSTGDHALRQRRVRFASVDSRFGVDMGYDELLIDGYGFDARGQLGRGVAGYGSARSRHTAMRLRGRLGRAAWVMGFRRWVGDTRGDLVASARSTHRSGHVARFGVRTARAALQAWDVGFDRDAPDSTTASSRRGVALSWRSGEVGEGAGAPGAPGGPGGADAPSSAGGRAPVATARPGEAGGERAYGHGDAPGIDARVAVEELVADMRWGAAHARADVRRASAHVTMRARGARGRLRATIAAALDDDGTSGWGGVVGLSRGRRGRRAWLEVARGFRVPSLMERAAPAHAAGARILRGGGDPGAETVDEVRGGLMLGRARLRAALSAGAMRSRDVIGPRPTSTPGERRYAAGGGDALGWLDVDVATRVRLGGLDAGVEAGVVVAGGADSGWFAGVPRVRTVVRARIGRPMFRASSALYADVSVAHTGARTDALGTRHDAFTTIDVWASGRLIDAHLYLGIVNLLDVRATTLGDALIPPRTLVYGLSWTIFD